MPLMPGKQDALIVVDMQNDFMPGGSLTVPEGNRIVPVINRMLDYFPWRILTRDWHPPDHVSFSSNPTFSDGSWPVHCVQNTPGADFHADLHQHKASLIDSKAMDAKRDAYSGFEQTELNSWLKQRDIQRVFITGVATDYCVKATALDAHANGFETVLIQNAIKGVDQPPGSVETALTVLVQSGIQLVLSGDILCS